MIVFPNAKINIGLNIVEKREDGFHNVESIMYPIKSLHDVLEVIECKAGGNVEFVSTGIKIPGALKSNLCIKAYELLKKDYNLPFVKIHLHKVIPIGAGLGGGSADAAFMLIALNKLFKLGLSDENLEEYAKILGSDCAFFIKNNPVYASGKGDCFNAVDMDLSDYTIKVEYPELHIGTREAYAGIIPMKTKKNLKDLIKLPIENWKGLIKNDFEISIFPNHYQIEELKESFYKEGAIYAAMTGSGSSVFGIFKK